MNKKVIIITQCLEELPFDIRSYRANGYSLKFNKLSELIEKLKCLLSGAIDGSVEFGTSFFDNIAVCERTVIRRSYEIGMKS